MTDAAPFRLMKTLLAFTLIAAPPAQPFGWGAGRGRPAVKDQNRPGERHGQIHQPLHCSARVHSYWDGGVGSFPKTGPNFAPPPASQVLPAAARIARKFPAAADDWKAGGALAFDQWSKASSELAQNTAYRRIRRNRVPGRRYNRAALRVAERRVAWVAALLNSIWPAR